MIKGLIALFSSKTILNPFVLVGIIVGAFFYFKFTSEEIVLKYQDYHIYLLVLVLAIVYHFVFKKSYKDGGGKIDFIKTGINIFASCFRFILASILCISFLYMISF